jgi:hypothetical protein
MPTIQELTDEYSSYSDEQLFDVWARINEYTPEAEEALKAIINQKGGLEALTQRLRAQAERNNEIQRLTREARVLLHQGISPAQVKDRLSSRILASDQITNITSQVVSEEERESKDRQVTPGTFLGALVGGLLGGTVGGIIFGISIIQSHRIMFIFGFGVVMICYGCVHLFTRKTSRNSLVFAATAMAALYAFGLAFMIRAIYG